MLAIQLGAAPEAGKPGPLDIGVEREAWRNGLNSFSSSPVLVGNRIYLTNYTGELNAVDAGTGRILWTEKLAAAQIHASPAAGDGKLYVPMANGMFYIIRPTDAGPEILSSLQLEGECLGQPAIANGRVYVHTTERLYCFQGSGALSATKTVRATEIAGPNRRRQPVLHAVGHPDDLVLVPERLDRDERPENLLLGNARLRVNSAEHRRLNEVAAFRLLDRVPKGTAYLIVVEALAPFAATAAACGGAMVVLGGASFADDTLWRDLIVLGTAAAMTAPRRFRGFANRTWKEGRSVDHLLGQLDEIVGVVGLLFVAAYFRPSVEVGWQLPGTAWVFVSIGLGVVIGVLIFAMVRVPVSNAEFLAVVLGSIAFGAGLAGYLFLSPLVVCFIAGALVTNFPCDQRDSIFRILNHLERPIHLLFLIVAGATWHVFDWRAWAIVPLFVVARIVGKWIGIFTASRTVGDKLPTGYADQRALVTPLSALSIALVVNSQGLGGELTSWITTVVIGAAILNEILVSITAPPRPAARAATELPALGPNSGVFPRVPPGAAEAPAGAAVIDELDHEESSRTEVRDRDAGPVYRDPDVDTDVGTDVGTDRGDKRGGR